MRVCVCACVRVCVCACVRAYVCMCLRACVSVCVRAFECTRTRNSVRMCVGEGRNSPLHVPFGAVQFLVSLHDTSTIRSPLGNLNPVAHVYLAVCPNVVRLNVNEALGSSWGFEQVISVRKNNVLY